MSEHQDSVSEEKAPIGIAVAFVGLPLAIIWLFWANYYVHYMESYTLTKTLFFIFLPWMLPFLNFSPFLTFYVAIQLILYDASKEFMVLLWYAGLVVVAILFSVLDFLQIGMKDVGGKPVLSIALGAASITLTVLMFVGPQIAFYTFLARLPLYIVSAVFIR
jgi:hypothetical protein